MSTSFYFRTAGTEGYREISVDDIKKFFAILDSDKSKCVKQMDLRRYIELFIKDIACGNRVTLRGTRFTTGTIKAIRQALKKFEEYQIARGQYLDFKDIDMAFYRDYTGFLMGQNYSINSIGKCIKNLKQILLAAEEDGYRINPAVRGKGFKVHQVKTDAIYLTQSDLAAIREVDLTGLPHCYEVARDIFMIGVWTAQRVSDYNQLSRENIQEETITITDPYGNQTCRLVRNIRLTQQKTGKRVVIPCSGELSAILDKYPNQLPHLYEQKLSKLMKEIGRMAGLDEMVELNTTKGGIPSKTVARKWELIQTHTARRTGATLMYLHGMDIYDICKITGHSSVTLLERYIKASELETARKISQVYDYFR